MADFSRPAAVRPKSSNATPNSAKQTAFLTSRAQNRDMTPSSTLLQDRLREKKARTMREDRARSHRAARHDTLFTGDEAFAGDRVTMSSPVQASQDMDDTGDRRRSDMASKKNSRSVGVREVNDIIDGLHKANFDLKLELYHRRARMTDLEQQLEMYKHLEDDNVELQEVNESLLAELEKRERAIEEAVAIICDLEERLEHYEEADTRPSTALIDTDASTLKGSDNTPQTSPGDKERPKTPQTKPIKSSTSSPRKSPRKSVHLTTPKAHKSGVPRRTPSFLTSEASSNAGVLRSLYLAGENDSKVGHSVLSLSRFNSTASRDAPAPEEGLDSPRLSVLSESSFVSVYGNTKTMDFKLPGPVIPVQEKEAPASNDSKRARAARVDRWIDHSSPLKPPKTAVKIVTTPTFGAQKTPVKNQSPERHSPRQEIATYRVRARREGKPDIDGKAAGLAFGAALLPPTPDTMSAAEGESLPKVPSLVVERSISDETRHRELRSTGHISTSRPLSAGGPHTRRRDKQEWQDLDVNDLASSDGELESLKGEFGDHDEFALDLTQLSVMSTLSPTSAKAFRSQAPGVARLGTYQGNILFTGEGLGLSPVNLSENCSHGYHIAPKPGHRSSSLLKTDARSRSRDAGARLGLDAGEETTPTQTRRRREPKLETPVATHVAEPVAEPESKEADLAATPANESRFPLSMRFLTPKSAGSSSKRNSLTMRLFSRNHGTENAAADAPEPPPHKSGSDESAPAPIVRPGRPINLPDLPLVPRHRSSTGSLDATRRPSMSLNASYDDLDLSIPRTKEDIARRNKRHSVSLEQYQTSPNSRSATDLSKLENQRYKPDRSMSDFASPVAGVRHRRRDSFFRTHAPQGEGVPGQETLPIDMPVTSSGGGRKWLPGSLGRNTSIKSPSEPSTRSSRHGFMGRIRGGKEKDKSLA